MIIYAKCSHVRGGVLYCIIDFLYEFVSERLSESKDYDLSLKLRSEWSLKLIILREILNKYMIT